MNNANIRQTIKESLRQIEAYLSSTSNADIAGAASEYRSMLYGGEVSLVEAVDNTVSTDLLEQLYSACGEIMKELGLPMPAVSIQPNSENDTNKHLVDENDVSPHYRKMYEDSYENSYEYSASKTFINRIRPSVLLELDFGLPVDGRVTVTTDYGFDSLTISGKTIQRWHGGVDLASSTPTSIIAAHSGYVEEVAADTIYGNNLYIRYARKFPKDTDVPFFAIKTRYSHLSSIRVRNDDWVEKGQVVGIMGSTGMSTGVHLDFRIYIDGKVVNPNKFYSLPFYEGQIK